MSKIKFFYTPANYINPETKKPEIIYKPNIPIRLQYRHRLVKIPVECLVDSGSDTNLFPAGWGAAAGINIKSGIEKHVLGIGGFDLVAYRHPVKLWINTKSINTYADFSFHHSIPILGRTDFFKYFPELIFNENKRYLQIDL